MIFEIRKRRQKAVVPLLERRIKNYKTAAMHVMPVMPNRDPNPHTLLFAYLASCSSC
jgi:hypothetical protein